MKDRRSIFEILFTMVISVTLSVGAYSADLSDSMHSEILRLSAEGDAQAEKGSYEKAVLSYTKALRLLPEPKTDWEACTWLLASIGDANFKLKKYEEAKVALTDAMHCPGAIGNPFIHLRLGQSQFELGNKSRANDELARAYMLEGKEIFADEDPKYFNYLKTVLKPPANGKW
jgi:tetratricopeptide (TPR) repeat protein